MKKYATFCASFVFILVLIASGLFYLQTEIDSLDRTDLLQTLATDNQFLGITNGDSEHLIHIGGGDFSGSDPTVFVPGGQSGADYFYAVIYLTDDKYNVLDKVDLRYFVKPGNIVEAWYVADSATVTQTPRSPENNVSAYYWNKNTGLAIAISGINVPIMVKLPIVK